MTAIRGVAWPWWRRLAGRAGSDGIRRALRIVVPYVVVSALWIYFSDTLAERLLPDTSRFALWSIAKGWLFVAVTALMLFVLVVGQSVRDRQAADWQRDSERRYRDTLDAMLEGCQIIGRDWRYLYVNETAARHGGRTVDALVGRRMQEVYPGFESTPTFALLSRCMRDREAIRVDNALEAGEGSDSWFRLSIQPVPEGLCVLSTDITDERRAEQERSTATEFLALINGATDTTSLVRAALEFVQTQTGCEAVGIRLREGDDYPYFEYRGLSRDVIRMENPRCDPPGCGDRPLDGTGMPESMALIALQVGQEAIGLLQLNDRRAGRFTPGQIALWERLSAYLAVGILKCRAEEETRRLNEGLERRVAERTAQLETANRELEAFSYSVSHDLRAPLRAVDGFGSILADEHADRLDDEGRRLLGVIRSEAARMGRLIDDLLAFSRLSRRGVDHAPIDMTALASDVCRRCTPEERAGRIRITVLPLPTASGDTAMIRLVFENLVSNAVKYTRPRPVAEITISGWSADSERIYEVRDNGVGFDMRFADRLFGVFQRLHSTEEFEGHGIGLALVQRIVHRHGGRVWAESAGAGGATFWFALPAGDAPP